MSLLGLWRDFRRCFRPAIDAIFCPNLPFAYRWRLLVLQGFELIAFILTAVPHMWHESYSVEYIEVRPGDFIRILVFRPARSISDGKLRPLHISIHGGAFCGGLPEQQAVFCQRVCRDTGAVAISISYRFAPRHTFPAAIDDVDAVIRHLKAGAAEKYGADPSLLTLSGSSAGGNLALAATQQRECYGSSATAIKGIVTYYPVVDLRRKPGAKTIPRGMPALDPLAFLFTLFDSYAAAARAENMSNARFSPTLADIKTLPRDLLFVIPTLDILVFEQLTFVERLRDEARRNRGQAGRRIEALLVQGQFHGWDQLPALTENMRKSQEEALMTSMRFLRDVHEKISAPGSTPFKFHLTNTKTASVVTEMGSCL